MRSAIDSAGRVVIPKALRDRLALGRSRAVEISERDGKIEIEPVATPMALLPPLTDDVVRATIERTRR